MKTAQRPRFFNPSFGIRSVNPAQLKRQVQSDTVKTAFKELALRFKEVIEIGKFEKVKVVVENPLKDCSIKKAYLVIEPSAKKNDERTRVLSFVAFHPLNENIKHSLSPASGTKFAMERVLESPATANAFKVFLRNAEKSFSF